MIFQDLDIENEEKNDDMGPDAWESIFWDIPYVVVLPFSYNTTRMTEDRAPSSLQKASLECTRMFPRLHIDFLLMVRGAFTVGVIVAPKSLSCEE